MNKNQMIKQLNDCKVVAVIRSNDAENVIRTVDACVCGGIRAIEITYTVPGATHIIEELSKKYAGTDVMIGAGTVIDAETGRNAILAGAEFIVSPTIDEKLIELCCRYRILCAAGAFTPNEVKNALELGADYVKIFPATLCTPSYLKVIHGPFPQAEFMVPGSMTFDTVTDWLDSGASVIGVGGLITDPAAKNDFEQVTKNAKRLCEIIHGGK